jgi:hypothetical protein
VPIDRLHIVCLDAPAPPDYGGAIDMFYKIRALAESGRAISLHYFNYRAGRGHSGLEAYCEQVYQYPRKGFFKSIREKQPYIVGSRNSPELLKRLLLDNAPVLLEGLHCTGLLPYFYGKRKLLVRMHNDEAAYYAGLEASERSPIKKMYYGLESRLLRRYQQALPKDLPLACVAQNDIETLRNQYGFSKLPFIPSFTPWQELTGASGRGAYCLYHGNMDVSENREAAEWLVREVFVQLQVPLIIAGKNIPKALIEKYDRANLSFLSNPDEALMGKLVAEAHIHVLPSFNTTGLKLKMLHALFAGRHCLTNSAGIAGTAFAGTVTLAETAEEFRAAIARLWEEPFTEALRQKRQTVTEVYSNRHNAAALNAWL